MGVTPIECQGTSPLKFVALSLLLYNEHAFQQTPQDPPIRSKQEQTLQTAATQQQHRAATQQQAVNNNEQQHGSNGNRNTAEKPARPPTPPHPTPPHRHGQAEPGQETAVRVTAWLRPSVTARQGLVRNQQ